MYELMFLYDSIEEGRQYKEETFKGTWQEMTAYVSSHGLVLSLDATLVL